ncbi:MAG: C45 family autoproteolytic acyltransferase/hydrolase [Desulfobacterota bacterium]|nr:C45 family autoproteolytic acyltransferase/hydrolase [Thermodesulfobacteriota bacterium]
MKNILQAFLISILALSFATEYSLASPEDSMLVQTTSVARFSGRWEEIGRQIGLTYPEYIVDFGRIMGFVLLMAGPGHGWNAETYYRTIEDKVPHSIKDHLRGLASGVADVLHLRYETAWHLVLTQNFATELLNMDNMATIPDALGFRGCTGFAVTSPAGTFLCHNTDATASGDNIVVLMLWQPTNGDYAYMTMDPPGWADVAYGLNEKGIGVTMNAGSPNIDAEIGLPINFMLRFIMEHAATLDEAVRYIEDYIDQGNNFGTGGALVHIVDFNTHEMAKIQVRSRFYETTYGVQSAFGIRYVASANHYTGQFNPDPDFQYESSFARYDRLLELIEQTAVFDRDACWNVLSDTAGGEEGPNTISRIMSSGGTMFGLVMTREGIQCTMGPPSLYRKKFGEPPLIRYADLAEHPVASYTAQPLSRQVILSWGLHENAAVSGYKVYRACGQKGSYALIKELDGDATQFIDTGLQNQQRYYYRLEAIGSKGTTMVYGPICATPKLRYRKR